MPGYVCEVSSDILCGILIVSGSGFWCPRIPEVRIRSPPAFISPSCWVEAPCKDTPTLRAGVSREELGDKHRIARVHAAVMGAFLPSSTLPPITAFQLPPCFSPLL